MGLRNWPKLPAPASRSAPTRVASLVAVIHNDPVFTGRFAMQDVERYSLVVASMGRTLIDRGTTPGAGRSAASRYHYLDHSRATSTTRYLEDCIPGAQYWDAANIDANRSGDGAASGRHPPVTRRAEILEVWTWRKTYGGCPYWRFALA
jgi:hypothetical protein